MSHRASKLPNISSCDRLESKNVKRKRNRNIKKKQKTICVKKTLISRYLLSKSRVQDIIANPYARIMINRRYELVAHLDSLTRCRAKLNFAAAKSTNFIDLESVEDELECARGASEGGSKKSFGALG